MNTIDLTTQGNTPMAEHGEKCNIHDIVINNIEKKLEEFLSGCRVKEGVLSNHSSRLGRVEERLNSIKKDTGEVIKLLKGNGKSGAIDHIYKNDRRISKLEVKAWMIISMLVPIVVSCIIYYVNH